MTFQTKSRCCSQLKSLDGIIDGKTYFSKRATSIKEQKDIENLIKSHRKADQIYTDFGCLIFDVAQRAGEIYGVRKPHEKQYLSKFVFSNLSLKDKNLQISFQLIFDAIKKYQKDGDELPDASAVRTGYSMGFRYDGSFSIMRITY